MLGYRRKNKTWNLYPPVTLLMEELLNSNIKLHCRALGEFRHSHKIADRVITLNSLTAPRYTSDEAGKYDLVTVLGKCLLRGGAATVTMNVVDQGSILAEIQL
jgi:hypothetical protein